jgi:hypothetical protein
MPRTFHIVPRNDIVAYSGEFFQHSHSGRREYYGFAPGLAIRKKQHSALEIDVRPLKPQNFAQAATRE